MNDRDCPLCGVGVLHGYLDGFPDVTLSRTPVKRSDALRLSQEGKGVAACRRAPIGGAIHAQIWHQLLGDTWTPLLEHDCEIWR